MKILVSAYACEPGKGSEPGVGWNFVKEMSKRHDLTVLTRANNRSAIERCGEDWTKRVRWVWYDPPRWLTFWKRGGRGVQFFYLVWQLGVAKMVRRSFRPGDFDLVHHITFGTYWIPSFLGSFGPPLVFGPVGGGDETPPAFKKSYSARGRFAEFKKSVAVFLSTALFRPAFRKAALAVAATGQNAEKLRRIVRCPVVVHPQSAISSEDAEAMKRIADSTPKPDRPRFVTACRLEHWKAVDLAIKAFPAVLETLPDATLEIVGTGPEEERLRKTAARLGLENCVRFLGRLPRLEDVYRTIAGSAALVHPALHESFGQACLEAVALGRPVVCWNHGGPGLIASRCGMGAVPVPDDGTDLSGLAAAMVAAFRAPPPALPDSFLWPSWCDVLFSEEMHVQKKRNERTNAHGH
ncbi:MAG: glycosyltransferase [Kiritimatiellae bacterium]|nr:glycosyltransferase [Kiritimatiellia bacterium]